MAAAPPGKSILPWRYGLFVLGFLSALPLAMAFDRPAGIMMGFDIGALLFLATMPPAFSHSADQMRRHANRNDANRTLILLITVIVTLVLLVAIASELRFARTASSWMLALIVATIILAWLFSNFVYTFHYAFLYYSEGESGEDRAGLVVPGKDEPDYWDFAYFAFTLGMTFQTSDVEITDPTIRKVVLFHCLAAFVFNLGILAFTINILGG